MCCCSCIEPCAHDNVLMQVPDHSRAEDVPAFMPYQQYSTLGQDGKGPSPPVAWKLKAPRAFTAGIFLICMLPSAFQIMCAAGLLNVQAVEPPSCGDKRF